MIKFFKFLKVPWRGWKKTPPQKGPLLFWSVNRL